ncbi:phage tail protein [Rhodanobacter sp. UC4450_H17]
MGKGGKVTIGYWYQMGILFGLSTGPIDALRKITGGGRLAWSGNATTSGPITINAPELYGGEKKEGGIQGTADLMMGEADQMPNAYLVSQLGTPMPAFRGKVMLVYRGIVGALNPYIKPWGFQVQRWTAGWRTPVWEPGLCQIDQGMNGAHFIYRAITDPTTGLGRNPDQALDLVRMKAAAQTLHDEGLGLCLKWSRSDVTGNFIRTVCDHVGGDFVDDPTTGKQYLKLYRGDYDINTVPLVDESNIVDLVSYEQSALAGSVNQIVVTYHDSETNKDAATPAINNLANIQAQGRVVSQSVRYDGVWNAELALRLGMRDLHASSSLPARMKLKVFSSLDVRKGDVLAFSWSRLNLSRMPIRVLDIDRGTPTINTITLSCAQDVYALPTTTYLVAQPPLWTAPNLAPQPITIQRLVEANYRDLAANLRAADLAAVTALAGYVGSLAARPAGVPINYALTTRIGTTGAFTEVAAGDFAPTGLLAAAVPVGAVPVAITLTSPKDLDLVAIGSEALIDDELFRVEAIDAAAGTATLARGCVDTVPAEHALGARVWCTDHFTAADRTEYTTGETIEAKLLTNAGNGKLDPALATTASILLNKRQIRPYPPGNLKINGVAYPASVPSALVLTWSHRDRGLQADQLIDTTAANVGPEMGTTYTVRTYLDGVLKSTTAGITGTTHTPANPGSGIVRIEVEAVRDGYTCWQPLTATFSFGAPQITSTFVTFVAGTASGYQLTEQFGTAPFTYSSGALPAGVTMDAAGLISYDGTGGEIATSSVSFTVTDANGSASTVNLPITVSGARRYWRIYITASDGSPDGSSIAELQLRAVSGGSTLCVGGVAAANATYSGTYIASKAFDANASTFWASSAVLGGPWILAYQLPTTSQVAEVSIQVRPDGPTVYGQGPKDFRIQSSADSTTGLDGTWVNEWAVSNQTGWTNGMTRIFTRP